MFGRSTNSRQYYPARSTWITTIKRRHKQPCDGLRQPLVNTIGWSGCGLPWHGTTSCQRVQCRRAQRPRSRARRPDRRWPGRYAASVVIRPLPPHSSHRGVNTRCPGAAGCLTLVTPDPPQAGQCFSAGARLGARTRFRLVIIQSPSHTSMAGATMRSASLWHKGSAVISNTVPATC